MPKFVSTNKLILNVSEYECLKEYSPPLLNTRNVRAPLSLSGYSLLVLLFSQQPYYTSTDFRILLQWLREYSFIFKNKILGRIMCMLLPDCLIPRPMGRIIYPFFLEFILLVSAHEFISWSALSSHWTKPFAPQSKPQIARAYPGVGTETYLNHGGGSVVEEWFCQGGTRSGGTCALYSCPVVHLCVENLFDQAPDMID